jgi:SPOR domain
MADHRKFFRPRRLAFGGRLFPHACFLAVSLAVLNFAQAEDAGLKNGAASLAAGKYDTAVRQFSATINADNVAPGEAAKALYLRGIAYRKLNQPSRAIADFGAAMWLGLPEGDRVKALVNRGLAYQSAGLANQGQADIALARKSGGEVDQLIAEGGASAEGAASVAAFSTSVTPESQGSSAPAAAAPASETPARTASTSGQWTTTANAETGETSSSNRVSRWWGSLTGSSSSEQRPAESPPPTPAHAKPPSAPSTGWGAQTQAGEAAAASAAPPAPSTGWGAQTQQTASATEPTSAPPAPTSPARAPSTGWGAQTQGGETVVASDASPSGSRWSRWFSKSAEAETPAAPAAAAPAPAGSGFQLQLATSRSEAEAQALWKKVSSENQQVAAAQPLIEKVDIGNFGTFYSLKIGPFTDKAESLKVCSALKRNGVDCSLVTQ